MKAFFAVVAANLSDSIRDRVGTDATLIIGHTQKDKTRIVGRGKGVEL
jgi:hypothetical protein